MPYLGNSGQFSNIYEKNHATSTLRIIEGSAGYDPVGEDYTLNATLQEVTDIGATTTNTVKFNNTSTSLTTLSRVGIANATPSYKLSVGGAVHMDDASSNVIIANGSAYIESNLVVGNSNLSVDTVNGYVGINKVSPEYELDVVGDIQITGTIYQNGIEYGGGGGGSSYWLKDPDTLYYNTSNVGIGTTDASSELHVVGNVQATYFSGDGSALTNIQSSNVSDFASNVSRIDNLTTDFASNVSRIDNLTTDLSSNSTRIDNVITDLSSNATRIDNLITDLSSNASRIDNLTTDLSTLTTDLSSNATRIDNLTTNLDSNVTKITNLTTNLDSNVTKITNLTTDLSSNATRIDNLTTDLSSNATRIDNLTTDLSSNATRIDNLTTDLSSNATRIDNLTTDLSSNATRIDNLTTDLSSNATRIDNLTTDLSSNATRIDNLTTDLSDNALRITAISNDLSSNATRIDNLTTDDVSEGSTNLYYTDSHVDTHLNTSGATTNQVLSWNGSDYAWVAQSSGGIALADLSVGTEAPASGDGGISYDSSSGVFTYTPPTLVGISGVDNVRIGTYAGQTSQSNYAIAIGQNAGRQNQDFYNIAIGAFSGYFSQGYTACAVGVQTGESNQGTAAVALGNQAGRYNQGDYAIALGTLAGYTGQHDNSIVLNASGSQLNTGQASSFYVKPVRGGNFAASALAYTSAGEVVEETNMHFTTSGYVGIGVVSPTYELEVSGNIYASQSITEFSDARFKENVEPIENALEKVCSIGGYTYNKIGDSRRNAGVLAQEVMTVLPEVVHGSEDTNYSVSYGNMVSLLIEAIKELKLEMEKISQSKT